MSTRSKFFAPLLVVAVAFVLIAIYITKQSDTSVGDKRLTRVSLRLPIPVVHTSFSPYYLAVDKGFFEKYGLSVQIEPGSPQLNPVKMVSQGTDSFGVLGGPELLLSARSRGASIVGIALMHKDADFVVLVSRKDAGSVSLRGLDKKEVGFFYGHISTDILHMLFKKQGIEVEEVDVGFNYGQLMSGALAAQWAFRTTAGLTLPAKGIQLNLISPADYGIKTQGHIVVTSEEMIREKRHLVQGFINGVLDGLKYSVSHPEEALGATVGRDDQFNREIGRQQLEILIPTIQRNTRPGWLPDEALLTTKRQMVDIGLLPSDFDLQPAYTLRFVEAYYAER